VRRDDVTVLQFDAKHRIRKVFGYRTVLGDRALLRHRLECVGVTATNAATVHQAIVVAVQQVALDLHQRVKDYTHDNQQ